MFADVIENGYMLAWDGLDDRCIPNPASWIMAAPKVR
jgi:hypothetical protein